MLSQLTTGRGVGVTVSYVLCLDQRASIMSAKASRVIKPLGLFLKTKTCFLFVTYDLENKSLDL